MPVPGQDQIHQQTHQVQQVLNPDSVQEIGAGANKSVPSGEPRTALTIKDLSAPLGEWPEADLKQIPILPPEARLEPGQIYVDLHDQERREFQVDQPRDAGHNDWIVPKKEVPAELWNKLRQVQSVGHG